MTRANNAPWFTKAGAASGIMPISHFVAMNLFALKGGGYGCLFALDGIDPESRTDQDLDVRVRDVEAAAAVVRDPGFFGVHQIGRPHDGEDRRCGRFLGRCDATFPSFFLVLFFILIDKLADYIAVGFQNLPIPIDIQAIGGNAVSALPRDGVALIMNLLVILGRDHALRPRLHHLIGRKHCR